MGDQKAALLIDPISGAGVDECRQRRMSATTINDNEAKITFKVSKCRTLRRGTIDLFDCLAKNQYLSCSYSLTFGNGYFCKHPQRNEFAERLLETNRINPSQTEKRE